MTWFDENKDAENDFKILAKYIKSVAKHFIDLAPFYKELLEKIHMADFKSAREIFAETLEKSQQNPKALKTLEVVLAHIETLEQHFHADGSLDIRAEKKETEKEMWLEEQELLRELRAFTESRFLLKKTKTIYIELLSLAEKQQYKKAAELLLSAPNKEPRPSAMNIIRRLHNLKKDLASLERLEPTTHVKQLIQGTMIDATMAEIDGMKLDMGKSSRDD